MLRKGRHIRALLGGLLLLPAGGTLAAETGAPLRLSDYIGQDVFGRHKAPVATLADIVIGRDGRVQYGIVERETLEAGAPLTAVPWEAFEMTDQGLAVNMSGSEMAQTPGFSEGELPDFASPEWRARTEQYFGRERTGQTAAGPAETPLPPFAELDRDGDGKLSRREVGAYPEFERQFERADADADGALDPNEFSAFEAGEAPAAGLKAPEISVDVIRRPKDETGMR